MDELLDNQNQGDPRDILSGDYEFKFGDYLSRGLNLVKKQFLILVGVLIVFGVISILAQFTIGFVPIVGGIAAAIFSAVLFSGYYIGLHKIARGIEPSFEDFFGGFKFFAPIALYQLVYILILTVISIPFVLMIFGIFLPLDLLWDAIRSENPEALTAYFENKEFVSNMPAIFGLILLLGLISLYVVIIYILVPPLIVLKKLGFWQAMELSRKTVNKKFFPFLLFCIVLGLINLAGAVFFFIGLLFTYPLSIAATYAIYEHLFHREDEGKSEAPVQS